LNSLAKHAKEFGKKVDFVEKSEYFNSIAQELGKMRESYVSETRKILLAANRVTADHSFRWSMVWYKKDGEKLDPKKSEPFKVLSGDRFDYELDAIEDALGHTLFMAEHEHLIEVISVDAISTRKRAPHEKSQGLKEYAIKLVQRPHFQNKRWGAIPTVGECEMFQGRDDDIALTIRKRYEILSHESYACCMGPQSIVLVKYFAYL
jgi:hypothetical protein